MKKSFIAIILITAAVFLFYGIRYARTPVQKQEATIVTFEESVSGEGYIVKKENVYTSGNSGTFYSYKSDGQRVAKNSKIASVYNGSVNSDVLTELNNVNKKIEELNNKSKTGGLFVSDSQNAESTVDGIKNKIISAVQSGDVSDMSDYKKEIIANVSGEENSNEAEIRELEAKKAQISGGITATSSDIYADMAGIYTENVDGLENVLTPEAVMTYTPSQFDAVEKPAELKKRTSAEKGEGVCKVIDNHTWYIMMKADADRLKNVKEKQKVSIGFGSVTDAIADAVVRYISPEENGEKVVVLSCDRYVEGILTMRSTDIRLILKSYTGYKIPIYALHIQDGKKGVMIDNEGSEEFRECEILYTDEKEGFIIVYPAENAAKQLQPMDHIVIGEKY